MKAIWTVLAVLVSSKSCLDNAISEEFRQKLVGNQTSPRPLGIWNIYGRKFSVDTPVALFQILVEEQLGYEVFADARGTGSVTDAFYGLAGCEQPENKTNQSCTGKATRHHAAIGLHVSSTTNNITMFHYTRVQRLRMGGMLEDLGSVGFVSQTGLQISSFTLQKALDTSAPLFLDDFRNYDARYHEPQRFFRRLDEIDENLLIPCDAWNFKISEGLAEYVEATADFATLNRSSSTISCSGRWWLAPSCRSGQSIRCFPCITPLSDGAAVFAGEIMQKATWWHMPLALGVAHYNGSSAFRKLVLGYRDVMFMFWEPSVEFQEVSPVFVRFPSYNFTQWSNGIMASTREADYPRHIVSHELAALAPDVRVMMQRMKLSLEALNQMILWSYEFSLTSDCFTCAAYHGACTWLKQNKDTWTKWIPQQNACFAGQGMYSAKQEAFVSERGNDVTCQACPPGRSSALVTDQDGDTAECRPCDPGSVQPSMSKVFCDLCPAGSYASGSGLVECTRCEEGKFQNQSNMTECQSCPLGMTTTMLGAMFPWECVCMEGWYPAQGWINGTAVQCSTPDCRDDVCVRCPEGMFCPGLSLELPSQKPGFWAKAMVTVRDRGTGDGDHSPWPENVGMEIWGGPFTVFQCRDQLQCPGGAVGSCAVGRKGRACGSCIKGYASEFDGTCAPCGGRSLWPILVMLLVTLGAIPLILVAGIFASRARRAALSIFMVSIIFGQVVVCLQALDAIYQLDIAWIDPAKAILQSLAVFNLDLDFSCVLPPQDYILEYAVQVTSYPVVLLITFLIWLTLRWASKQVPFNAFVNAHGLLIVALLTAMTLTILRPLQCKNNPSGLFTIASRPDIICWETAEHLILFWLALAGILAYPVTILASIAYLTMKYPVWLRSGGGIEIMERYRFLFARFRPERYYYGLILCAHNLIVAVIPAALASMPALQVGIMGIVICLKLIVQILLWPWRLEVANYNDLALSAGLLILLLLASPLLNISQEETLTFVAILLSSVMVVLPLVAMFAALAVVFARLRPQSKFAAFLCHHKAGAGALCRFFKLVAKKYVKINIFLDSDELDDLSRIFDVVRADTKCLVVVLTSELLNRMWCAGEIASAHKNKVPIIPLYCDGYAFPDHDSIDVVESVWTEEQQSTLISYGISMDDIKAAYKHVSKLKSFAFCRFWTLEEQEEKILQVVAASSQFSVVPKVLPSSVAGARILVCVRQVPESISVGLILQQMVQHHLRSATHTLRTEEEIYEAKKAFGVLFVLSHGVLEDVLFARCLLACRQRSMQFVPVNDGTFQFPLSDFISEVEHGRHEVIGPEGLSPNIGPLLAKAYQALLSILALPLTAHGSSGILERQVAQICQRFGEDEPRMHRAADVERVDSGTEEDKAADAANSGDLELECESVKSINTDDLWHV